MKSLFGPGLKSLRHKYVLRQIFLGCLCIFCPDILVLSQNYFQQEVNNNISVRLNDLKHELDGFESIEYINNSPDTLGFLYFHLWPNGYSNNKTALAKELFSRDGKGKLFNDPALRGFMDSLDFRVDGRQAPGLKARIS